MKLFSVTNWDELFENNRTRDMKVMQWVPVPNKHDGEGFTDLLTQPNGTALYGAWHLILQVASKCKKRGVLLKDTGIPHDAASIAAKTRGSVKAIDEALQACVRIGWLIATEWDETTCTVPAVSPHPSRSLPAVCPHPTDEEEKRRNGMEENGNKGELRDFPLLQTPEFQTAWDEWKKFRIEKKKPLTPTSISQQLKDFTAWGPAKAVTAIQNSIRNGWQGVFKPTDEPTGREAPKIRILTPKPEGGK